MIYEQTMNLRIVVVCVGIPMIGIPTVEKLQQAWVCRETGDVEWRDVEKVMEVKK